VDIMPYCLIYERQYSKKLTTSVFRVVQKSRTLCWKIHRHYFL